MMNHHPGKIFMICGPSGSGKTYLSRELCKIRDSVKYVRSCTTRQRRPGESFEYIFMDDGEFNEHISGGDFIEYAVVYGRKYGFLRKTIFNILSDGNDAILIADIHGIKALKEIFPDSSVSILVYADEDFTKVKVLNRPGIKEDLDRIEKDKNYISVIDRSVFDFEIVNKGDDKSIEDLTRIYDSMSNRSVGAVTP